MYVTKVRLKGIRCFEDAKIEFDLSGDAPPFTLIVGDNATGKTTLMRALAMGLCDASSAAGLMREADSGYIRKGTGKGTWRAEIAIDLKAKNGKTTHRITTTIEKGPSGIGEQLKQKASKNFVWNDLFVCGYGAGRGTSGTGDIAGYSVINAVYTLFNYSEGLQNPELTILRINPELQKEVRQLLKEVLQATDVRTDGKGISVDGPWGKNMPLRDLADGYKSTFLWVTDFLGWAVSRDPGITDLRKIEGIVLLDEIDQHLHPKWQEEIVNRLRTSFSNIQFIATTHSPLVAKSIGLVEKKNDRDNLIHLELLAGNKVEARGISTLRGWRADQVLASQAFDYVISSDRDIETLLYEASKLSGKGNKRTATETKRYRELKAQIANVLISEGETPIEREIEGELDRALAERIKELKRELLGLAL